MDVKKSDLITANIPKPEIIKRVGQCVFPIFFGGQFIGNCFYISDNVIATSWHTFEDLWEVLKESLFSLVYFGLKDAPKRFTRLLYPDPENSPFDIAFLETESVSSVWLPLDLTGVDIAINDVLIMSHVEFSSDRKKSPLKSGNPTELYCFETKACRFNLDTNTIRLTGGVNKTGQSGSPIYCLRTHSVIGIVDAVAKSTIRLHTSSANPNLQNDTEIFSQLIEQGLPEGLHLGFLPDVWPYAAKLNESARQCWDETILHDDSRYKTIFNQFGKCQDIIKSGSCGDFPYVKRAVEEEALLEFWQNKEPNMGLAFLLTGNTGAGKSAILFRFLQGLSNDDCVVLFLKNEHTDMSGGSLEGLFAELLQFDIFSQELISFVKLYLNGRALLFAVDELNHLGCSNLDLAMKKFVVKVQQLWTVLGNQKAKVIFVIRSEFVSSLKLGMLEQFWIYRKTGIGKIEEQSTKWMALEDLDKDLRQDMYNAYSKFDSRNSALTFDQLPPNVDSLLCRPAYFPMFMDLYHRKAISRSAITSVSQQRFGLLYFLGKYIDENDKNSYTFLRLLAINLFNSSREYINQDMLQGIDSKLLLDLIEDYRIVVKSEKPRGYIYKFSFEWVFEWFLADHFLNELENGSDKSQFILELPERFDKNNKSSHLAAVFFNMAILIRDENPSNMVLIIDMLNLPTEHEMLQVFTKYLFDELLVDYTTKSDMSNSQNNNDFEPFLFPQNSQLSHAGAKRLLVYVESLESLGEYDYGYWLLTYSGISWPNALAAGVCQRQKLTLAFHLLYLGRKTEAYDTVKKIEIEQCDLALEEKRKYILGRTLQYANQYDDAANAYRLTQLPTTKYGILCQHQLAFCTALYRSEYLDAVQLLETILAVTDDLNPNLYESKLLLYTCQIRLGRYSCAMTPLAKLIENRHKMRHTHKEATARRALADLYLCSFQGSKALKEIELSLSLLADIGNNASLIYSFDIYAQIKAFLFNDYESALEKIDQSIALAKDELTKNKHMASFSWNLQTRRLLLAINGRADSNPQDTQQLSSALSPYQIYRQRFIELMEKIFTSDKSQLPTPVSLINEVVDLLQHAIEKGWGWYPIILKTVLYRLQGQNAIPCEEDWAGWAKTPLCERIYTVLCKK